MIEVTHIADAKDHWINEHVQLLGAPWQDDETGGWHALAKTNGWLVIVSLKVTPIVERTP